MPDNDRHPRAAAPSRLGFRISFWFCLIAGLVVFTVMTPVEYLDGQKSQYVQHHGISTEGAVINVAEQQHCGRYGPPCNWTARLSVIVPLGHKNIPTIVRYPHYWHGSAGQLIKLLLDPRDESHAEIPGAPYTSSSAWILYGVGAIIWWTFAAFLGWAYLAKLRQDLRAKRRRGGVRR